MMNCVVVDDEPLALALLRQYIHQRDGLELLQGFSDAVDALKFLNKTTPDILFLDVQMPDMTGIHLLKNIIHPPLVVIFTTAYRDYAIESYELGVVDYLLKPFSFDRFNKAILRAEEILQSKLSIAQVEPAFIFVKSEYKLVKILFDEILYAESMDDYIRIHLKDSRPVITLMSMKSIETRLPQQQFRRIHRKFLVSINKIKTIQSKKIVLDSDIEIPIGDTYQSSIQFLRGGN